MSLFQKVRDLFGMKTEIQKTQAEILDDMINQSNQIESELEKAQSEYSEISHDLELKIAACDKLMEKGSSEASDNRIILQEKLNTVNNVYFDTVRQLVFQQHGIEERRVELESDIIAKAIEVTAALPDSDQAQIKDIIDVWSETGFIKGEEVGTQVQAISKALEIVLALNNDLEKAGEGSRGGKVVGHTKGGHPIYAKLKKFLSKFPDDAKSWAHATDEVRDLARSAKEHYNEIDLDVLHEDPKAHQPLDFKSFKTPSEWNTKGKKYIFDTVDKMSNSTKDRFMEQHSGWLDQDDEIEKAENGEEVEGHYANVIVRKDDKILFLKRASNKVVAPNQYCLPGGHIDAGETIQQAAARELKEEANIDCNPDCLWIVGKAKCDDGKWAYYLSRPENEISEVMLLDGESQNAAWMSQDEWMQADLFFDLKQHLIDIQGGGIKQNIPEIGKAEDEEEIELFKALTDDQIQSIIDGEEFYIEEVDEEDPELEKAEGSDKSKKKPVAKKKKKKLSVDQVKAHSENTSSGQLKKVSKNEKHEHRDAAKRELERRASEKEKKQEALNQKQIQHIEKRVADIEKRRAQILKKLEDANSPNAESLERELISLGKECRKLCEQIDKMDA